MDSPVIADWLRVIVPFISGAIGVVFGVGVTYGSSRTRLRNHSDRIGWLENMSRHAISQTKFVEYRRECRDDFKEDIHRIETTVQALNTKFDRYLLQSLAREDRHGQQ